MKTIIKIQDYSITQIGSTFFIQNGAEGLGYSDDYKKAERIFNKALKNAGL